MHFNDCIAFASKWTACLIFVDKPLALFTNHTVTFCVHVCACVRVCAFCVRDCRQFCLPSHFHDGQGRMKNSYKARWCTPVIEEVAFIGHPRICADNSILLPHLFIILQGVIGLPRLMFIFYITFDLCQMKVFLQLFLDPWKARHKYHQL